MGEESMDKTPPPRQEGLQANSDGAGFGGTDDTAENEDDEEVCPKVSKTKMTPRGGRHEPYERKEAAASASGGGGNAPPAELVTKRLYVGNLTYSTTWRELKDHMATAGNVTRADVLQTHDGRSKGCGIVEYATREEAMGAIEALNDSELMGRQIFVREDREANKAVDASSKRVYVGNLAYEVAWQDLKDHMRDAGDVAYAEVMMMNDGRSKGCGIVEFQTVEGAKEAIERLNDTELMGRQIFVREDREMNKIGGGSGQLGGGGGGGWNRVGGGGSGGGRGNGQWGNTSVYVGNLAYETTWQDLKDHMRRVGNIDKADILQGADGRSKGCGIVIYQNPKEAQRAIRELQNSELNGRPIFVREDREASSGGGGGNNYNRGNNNNFNRNNNNNPRTSSNLMPGQPTEQGCQLFIGNLSWGTGWRDLKDHFGQCGQVDRAEVAEGPDGRKKGFGLIRFHSAGDAQNAIERLNGVEFMGRNLEVRLDNKV